MKALKRIAFAIMTLITVTSVFAKDEKKAAKVKVTDKISSDIVEIRNGETFGEDEDESKTYFAGMKNKVTFNYDSEKISAQMKITFNLKNFKDPDEDVLYLTGKVSDYYVEYRPIEQLGLGFHETIFTPGSYLPIWDDNSLAGEMGSSGFTLIVKPIKGLRFTGSIPAPTDGTVNILNGEEDETYNKKKYSYDEVMINAGFDYNINDIVTIGFAMQDIVDNDERSFGAFVSLNPIDGLQLNGGYSRFELGGEIAEDFSGDFNINGKNIITFGAEYENDNLLLQGDFAMTPDDDESLYDLYGAIHVEVAATESVSPWVEGLIMTDNNSDTDLKPLFGVKPGITWVVGNCTLKASVALEFSDDDSFVSFPVSAKFKF